jgi:hypothetical protein
MQQPLLQAQTLTLDGNGAGQLRFGPVPAFQVWTINIMSVTTSGPNTKQALVQVYRNVPGVPTALVDGTYSGNFDTSQVTPALQLQTGEALYVVWSGGNANAVATYRIEGIVAMADYVLGAN